MLRLSRGTPATGSMHASRICGMHSGKAPIVRCIYIDSRLIAQSRWGTIPIVRIAQEEKIINFPFELDTPWAYLRQMYGLNSQGGSAMSNFYCNFDRLGKLVYHINSGMSEKILSAECSFVHSFIESEKQVCVASTSNIEMSLDLQLRYRHFQYTTT